jgi:phosphoribosylformimino-5-aminoimidazole carboxamide ribonucleotide (ProFAR) isomerase
LKNLGFDRALVTDVSRDGTLAGPGVEAATWVAQQGFQVQASGGVKELADLRPLSEVPGIVGAISGKALMEGFIQLDNPRTRQAVAGVA